MLSLFDPTARRAIAQRLDRLAATSQPLWGRMNVGQMVVHCTLQLQLALGELAAAPMASGASRFPMKQLLIYVLPWPKGVPTFPELRDPLTTGWDADRNALRSLIERFGAQDPRRAWPAHAAFGPMSGRAWGVLAARHLDHHLRQFGA
jgi:hypothetical protein